MAGRSVGSIEVTVDADTGRLKAQLTKAGREGGQAATREIDKALDDIDAEVGVEVKKGAARRDWPTDRGVPQCLDGVGRSQRR